jgi:chemotaxis protein histidine kinase CheA
MTADAFKRQLAALSAEYRGELPGKLDRVETLWRDLAAGTVGPERLADLVRELHSIAGSARTFGVAGVSEAAAAAESYLGPFTARHKLPARSGQAEFARLLKELRRTAA